MKELGNLLTSHSLGSEHVASVKKHDIDDSDRTAADTPVHSPLGSVPVNKVKISHEANGKKDSTLDREMGMAERELLTEEPFEESEVDIEEEEVQLVIEESSLDKLARMLGP